MSKQKERINLRYEGVNAEKLERLEKHYGISKNAILNMLISEKEATLPIENKPLHFARPFRVLQRFLNCQDFFEIEGMEKDKGRWKRAKRGKLESYYCMEFIRMYPSDTYSLRCHLPQNRVFDFDKTFEYEEIKGLINAQTK